MRLRGQPLLRWIAFSSVVFYAFAGHWWFIIPMLVTTVVDYWVAIFIERERRPGPRAWLLGLSLAGNLGMLAYFKYSGLFVRTAEQGLVFLGIDVPAGSVKWFESCCRPASASTRSRRSPTSSTSGGASRPPCGISSSSPAS